MLGAPAAAGRRSRRSLRATILIASLILYRLEEIKSLVERGLQRFLFPGVYRLEFRALEMLRGVRMSIIFLNMYSYSIVSCKKQGKRLHGSSTGSAEFVAGLSRRRSERSSEPINVWVVLGFCVDGISGILEPMQGAPSCSLRLKISIACRNCIALSSQRLNSSCAARIIRFQLCSWFLGWV